MFKNSYLAISCLFFPLSAFANELYLDANRNTAHLRFDGTHSSRGLQLSGAALITDDRGSLLSAGIWTHGTLNADKTLRGGVGMKAYVVDAKSDDFAALGLGGHIDFSIPNFDPIEIRSELFYSPSVTITEDYDNLLDFNLNVFYKLFENGSVYAGVRKLQADANGGEYEFDDDLHVGINFSF